MKISIGSPALTGIISSQLLADHFASAAYPMRVLVINHTPRSFRHNDLGIFLQTCAGGIDTQVEVTVRSFSQIQKLCTEAEAISELNHFDVGIEIHDLDAIEAADKAAKFAAASNAPEKATATSKPEIALDPFIPAVDSLTTQEPVTVKKTKKGGDNA